MNHITSQASRRAKSALGCSKTLSVNMEIITSSIFLVGFSITAVLGGISFIKGAYYIFRAISNRNLSVSAAHPDTKFNICNALWVKNALTDEGKQYRIKGLKNIALFLCLLFITMGLAHLTGFDNVST